MTMRRVFGLGAVLLLCSGPAARAQEQGKVGITMGYPASIGILWHATEKVALRPELSITGSHSDSSDSDSVTVGTGLSALFYGAGGNNVRPYISPRFNYAHSGL